MDKIPNRFAPGCALMLYKPELAKKVHTFLNQSLGPMELHLTCCRHDPNLKEKTNIINICPGCDKRFKRDYPMTTTLSLWEILSQSDSFPFPDYHGKTMTILDACPVREEEKIHAAIRILLQKMNIRVIEPEKNRNKSKCCGDSFYGVLPVADVKKQMQIRADEMPAEDVVVYCVSCVKSIFNGGKHPRYLVDLLFNEETFQGTVEPDEWHQQLGDYIGEH